MSKTVLVVDDDSHVRALLVALLTLEGYQVRIASDGEDGLEVAKRQLPDLIVLDGMMPTLDGLQTLDKLNAIEELSALPVVFTTASVDAARLARERLGKSRVLQKPFNVDSFLGEVRQLIGDP